MLAQARDVGGLGQAGGSFEVGQAALEDGVQQQFRHRPVHLEVLDGAAEGALEGGDQDGAQYRRQAGGEQQPAEVAQLGVGGDVLVYACLDSLGEKWSQE